MVGFDLADVGNVQRVLQGSSAGPETGGLGVTVAAAGWGVFEGADCYRL
ncbi:MAG: hypothetical protein QOF66_4199, partial [Mycobacterium sp.]|nr:hypothetical protein [Mycobacterium sp.]